MQKVEDLAASRVRTANRFLHLVQRRVCLVSPASFRQEIFTYPCSRYFSHSLSSESARSAFALHGNGAIVAAGCKLRVRLHFISLSFTPFRRLSLPVVYPWTCPLRPLVLLFRIIYLQARQPSYFSFPSPAFTGVALLSAVEILVRVDFFRQFDFVQRLQRIKS